MADRNLDPQSLAFAYELQRGALLVLPSTTPANTSTPIPDPRVLRFQFNPETVTRTRTGAWDSRKNKQLVGPKANPVESPGQKSEKDNFRGGGMFSKSETIAMKLVFDATELLLRDPTAVDNGILPELAVLELIALGEAPKDDDKKKKDPKNELNSVHPKELILVLGKRYFPVIITQMTITEKRFSNKLAPIRAEVDLQMQVLEATEVDGDKAVRGAYNKLISDRLDQAVLAASSSKVKNLAVDDSGSLNDAIADALRRPPGGFT
jgi:Contractile injection system tube protein